MWNIGEAFDQMRRAITEDYEPGRERALVMTKLDEAELWLTRCHKAHASTRPNA